MVGHSAGGLRAGPHPGPLARWGVTHASRHADAGPADGDGDRHADAEVDAGRLEVNVGRGQVEDGSAGGERAEGRRLVVCGGGERQRHRLERKVADLLGSRRRL